MATMLLRFDGLDADGARQAEALLRGTPGVFGVVVSPSAGCAEVDIEDDEVDIDEVIGRLREAGLDVHLSG